MANQFSLQAIEWRLRRRIGRFFVDRVRWRQPLFDVTDGLRRQDGQVYVFGGTIRNLAVEHPPFAPRDIDLVAASVQGTSFVEKLKGATARRNRFGGLHIEHRGWLFDLWALSSTWAIKEGFVTPAEDFSSLPLTTFLNVEAVAVELFPKRGRRRVIHERGFFRAVQSRTVDINLEPNPFPVLCAVRSLITAAKLGFHIAPRLASYIVNVARSAGVEQLMHTQSVHYGFVRVREAEIASWVNHLENRLAWDADRAISLPVPRWRQSLLWSLGDEPNRVPVLRNGTRSAGRGMTPTREQLPLF